jgi:hypothetical protein
MSEASEGMVGKSSMSAGTKAASGERTFTRRPTSWRLEAQALRGESKPSQRLNRANSFHRTATARPKPEKTVVETTSGQRWLRSHLTFDLPQNCTFATLTGQAKKSSINFSVSI